MLLEVLLGRGDELDGSELEAAVLEARDDGADEAALQACQYRASTRYPSAACCNCTAGRDEKGGAYLDAVRLDGNEAIDTSAPDGQYHRAAHARLLGGHLVELSVLGGVGFDVASEKASVLGAEVLEDGRVGDARGELC